MSDRVDKFTVSNVADHISKYDKDMWAGSTDPIEQDIFIIIDNKIKPITYSFAPALEKCFDEPIVNAIDHDTRCNIENEYNGHQMKYIKCYFDKDTGEFSIENDGPGIPIAKKNDRYIPELICAYREGFVGTNIAKDGPSLTGGTNGIGLKIVTFNSVKFIVETCDGVNKYHQVIEDKGLTINLPKITKAKKQFTKFTYLLDYSRFGEVNFEQLYKIIEFRLYMAAMFCSSRIKLYFNDELIKVNTKIISEMLDSEAIFTKKIFNVNDNRLCWEISLGVNTNYKKGVSLHCVNGVNCIGGGHEKYLLEQIYENVKKSIQKDIGGVSGKKLADKLTESILKSKLSIVSNLYVYDSKWGGQRKDNLKMPKKVFTEYDLKTLSNKQFNDCISEYLIELLLPEKKTTKRKEKLFLDKYRKAEKAGTKESLKCLLALTEGDSANEMVRRGLQSNKKLEGFKYIGTLTLGGVIINVGKDIKTRKGVKIIPKKVLENQFVKNFMAIMGLEFNQKYDTKSSLSTLNYGGIVTVTDQDTDGIGNIFGLIVYMIRSLWPELIDHGFIKRMSTPIVKMFPKRGGKILEFDRLINFERYLEEHPDAKSKYEINYYKGLAGHETEQVPKMFENFYENLIEYYADANCDEILDIYFGNNTALRKKELSTPVLDLTEEENKERDDKRVSITNHVIHECKEFQLDNLQRKLPILIDGLNEARRKVLAGMILRNKSKKEKVFQACAGVAEIMIYEHGSASLDDTVKKMSMNFKNNLPLLIGIGSYGSNLDNGASAGAPRYISTILNKRLVDVLFPEYDLLKFRFSEGERVEPEYFVPIIPTVMAENYELPAHGWKITSYARTLSSIFARTRAYINGKKSKPRLEINLGNFTGKPFKVDDKIYTIGKYKKVNNKTIIITELPYGEYVGNNNCGYIKQFVQKDPKDKKKTIGFKKDIDDIIDNSTEDQTNIKIIFKNNYESLLPPGDNNFDPIILYLNLRSSFNPNLNMIGIDGSVKELKNYNEIFDIWYNIRKELYDKRINRDIIILREKIKREKNILRYVSDKKITIHNKSKDNSDKYLLDLNFDKINTKLLSSYKFKSISELISGFENSCDYEYIYDLRARDQLESSIKARKTRIENLERELEYLLQDNVWKILWLDELSKLEEIIEYGRSTNWEYENYGKYK